MNKLYVLAGLLICLGCAGPQRAQPRLPRFETPLRRVEVGMTARRVRDILGEPAAIEQEQEPGTETWYYENGWIVILREGRVQFRGRAAVPGPSGWAGEGERYPSS